jgi:hypothetical protein
MNVGDLYQSHRGKGRELAIVEAIVGGRVVLRYINRSNPTGNRGRLFELPLTYFHSPACGWALVDAERRVVPS